VPAVDLVVEPWALSVCRLEPAGDWPGPPAGAPLHAVIRTPGELTVVCATGDEPVGARVEPGWRAIRVVGPLAFDLVGILASLADPLATAQVAVFVLSTFDSDLVLVQGSALESAVEALAAAGHGLRFADT
jgi:uncharacterized protein